MAFFYDLYANYNDPALAQTMDNLLRAHGVTRALPATRRGARVPEMLYGYSDRASADRRVQRDRRAPVRPGRATSW